MKQKKDLYLVDFSVVIGVGIVHSFAYPRNLQNNFTYNMILLSIGTLYWCSQIILPSLLKRNTHYWSWVKSPYDWFKGLGYVVLAFSYWLCPVVATFDFIVTESEGALSFTFLALGVVPFRYFADSFWISETEVSINFFENVEAELPQVSSF